MIGRLGVEFRLNCEIGRDVSFTELEAQHDAVFIGIGLGETNSLGIHGEELANVIDAMTFIEQVKTRDWDSIYVGKNVVVIGGGNTAIDAATQAKRLGAENVTMMYRRTEAEAPAYEYELEIARQDGVEFLWQTTPTAFGGFDRVLSMRVRGPDGGEYKIACDMAIKAIGQRKQAAFLRDVIGIETDDGGRAVVGENMQTSRENVFAGGDCVNGGAEAVDAAQMGKHAAAGIHKFLTGEIVLFAGAEKIS
jgi:glutamate synthase (NADPH/NADH) small chain